MPWVCRDCGAEMVIRQYYSTVHKVKKDLTFNKTKVKGSLIQPSHMMEFQCSECNNCCTDSVLALEVDNMAYWED